MNDDGASRYILLITSQWPAGGEKRALEFLPPHDWEPGQELPDSQQLAVDLYGQFLDPEAGACAPVPDLASVDGVKLHAKRSSLVINPDLSIAKKVLAHAFDKARENARILVVHYIGHGLEERAGEADPLGHRLLLIDSEESPGTDDEAWNAYHQAGQLIKSRQPPGFVFLVDACQASRARPEVGKWGTNPSTHVWMGASQNSSAYDGCFSRTLCEVMRSGDHRQTANRRPVPELHSRHMRPLIDERCLQPDQKKYQQADDATSRANDYVYITRNRAIEAYESRLGLTGATRDRLRSTIGEDYQIIDVSTIETALEDDPFVVITGSAGTGKTALAAVLRDPPDDLEIRRVDAVTFLESNSTLETIAETIRPQLAKHPHYEDLVRRHEQNSADLQFQDAHRRYVDGPMSHLGRFDSFIVCLDGLDQLHLENQPKILAAYRSLTTNTGGRFRILATSRPESAGGPIPQGARTVAMPALDFALARKYLARKGLDDDKRQDQVLELGDELNWLVLTLAADQLLADPDLPLSESEGELYKRIMVASEDQLGSDNVQPIIDVLAASGEVAGVGPRLPFSIFTAAVEILGGPTDLGEINNILAHARLYPIIERSSPATPTEHLGLFHLTAIKALSPPDDRRRAAHSAINDVLNELMAAATPDVEAD